MNYDLVVVGGGIAGSTLARRVAATGTRVLVVERETEFRDRVRGEALQPWGVHEAELLGVGELLRGISAEMKAFRQLLNGMHLGDRDLLATTTVQRPMYGLHHPRAQQVLIEAAAAAGAEVRRGATVERITPGPQPKIQIKSKGASEEVSARLVAVCAGRNPALRAELGFVVKRDSIPQLLSGVWVTNLPAEVDSSIAYICNDVIRGEVVGLFPQPGGYARAYYGFDPANCKRLQGDGDFARFIEHCNISSDGQVPTTGLKAAGPLASFECADAWVERPYRDGVALVGDAAASSDPCWGQGLSLSMRDARVLSDELLGSEDWQEAGERYAARHDEHYGSVHMVSGWFYDMFERRGPEAEARRARALPLLAEDPTRAPDVLFSGPDTPVNDASRARFFGEDVAVAASA